MIDTEFWGELINTGRKDLWQISEGWLDVAPERGRREGDAVADWLQAERELAPA